MSQWENLPQPLPERPVAPVSASWAGFSADPRVPANQPLRASDADRDFASLLLSQARAEGRLDQAEHDARALAVSRSRTLGELAPQVADVMVAHAAAAPSGPGQNRFLRAGVAGWAGLALMFNAIWLMTVLTTGQLLYYWPMWPMLGTGIPVVIALLYGGSGTEDAGRAARRAEYRAARDGHRALRDERKAGRDQRRADRYEARAALRRGETPPELPPGPDLR